MGPVIESDSGAILEGFEPCYWYNDCPRVVMSLDVTTLVTFDLVIAVTIDRAFWQWRLGLLMKGQMSPNHNVYGEEEWVALGITWWMEVDASRWVVGGSGMVETSTIIDVAGASTDHIVYLYQD